MQTIRTTIRIRKELLDQSRLIALHQGTSLQAVINETLTKGFGYISDFDIHQEAMAKIDEFRNSFKKRRTDVKKLVADNKKELQARTNRLLYN